MLEFEHFNIEINNYKEELQNLERALHLDEEQDELEELTKSTADPEFWSDTDRARNIQQRISAINNKADEYHRLTAALDDLQVLNELGEEEADRSVIPEIYSLLKNWQRDFEHMKLRTLLTDEHDSSNAIVTLHAGAGGTESQDWVEMLYRMYSRWAENNNFELKLLDLIDGDEAGIKSVTFKVSGTNAYGYLRSEHGVHRLVRISPFDSSGRRHTSFASMEVLPELDDSIEIEIDPDDLKVDVFRSSGAGGQHVNKTSSAVRMTHLPTGIVVSCQNERSQMQNRETALKMLKAKLYTLAKQKHMDRIEDLKGDMLDIAWGSQIRSYVFCPYTMVKDHRTGCETSDIDAVMDGEIDDLIYSYLAGDQIQK